MNHRDLIILSYHKFVVYDDPYPFSRTFEQFDHDIRKKVYDWITIDDGLECTFRACEMLKRYNRRAKLFICSSLIGKEGYLTWEQVRQLSAHHDIECHGHVHVDHRMMDAGEVAESIRQCCELIEFYTGRRPRYFVAPYNLYNDVVIAMANIQLLVPLIDRITIKNDSK